MEKNTEKKFDLIAVENHIKGIIEALGGDISREGLIDTPKRVARMYAEVFEGMKYSNAQIAEMFGKGFTEDARRESDDIVVVRDIEAFSHCEHHLALMYDMSVTVAYIPRGKLLGLSKIARIADMAARRLQLQERLGADIAEIMTMATGAEDVAVRIEAYHSCMTARGIKKAGAKTVTSTLRGRFKTDSAIRERFYREIA